MAPPKRSGKTRPKTLFDPSAYNADPILKQSQPLYTRGLDKLAASRRSMYYAWESDILSDIARSEAGLVVVLTGLVGPVEIRQSGEHRSLSRRSGESAFYITGLAEVGELDFIRCSATGILVVEKGVIFDDLVKSQIWREFNWIILTGFGIPRAPTRRILQRLTRQFRLPVYLLADNDTWGYYLFSVLKRGASVPHVQYPDLAVPEVRFLGLRAGDLMKCGAPADLIVPWKKQWDWRLRAMSRYPCFQTRGWQEEFGNFVKQGGKVELEAISCFWGKGRSPQDALVMFMRSILMPRVRNREWLL